MKKFFQTYGKTILWLLVAGFAMALLYAAPWVRSWTTYLRIGSFTSSTWIVLWVGNSYMARVVSARFPWTKEPLKTFIVAMVATVGYTIAALYADVLLFEFVSGVRFLGDIEELIWTSLVVTMIVSLFMHGRSFLNGWRMAEINSTQLQKESIRAQYDSLKSQVNPHFLFNSLNALTNLIYEDQDKAVHFVKQLSEVYRYVLDTQGKEVVPLADEMKFLGSYSFLQQIRFGDKLRIDINIDSRDALVAPLALQMLVENAIKHNVISVDQPLMIKISGDKKNIVVENNIQKKNVLPDESKGIGLENIKRRYSFLSEHRVEVIDNGISFKVNLPMIEYRTTNI